MKSFNDKFLTGKCLISNPEIKGRIFDNSIVYICSHNKDGALGFIVNKKMQDISIEDITEQMNIENKNEVNSSINIYQGGPMDKIRGFVLHSTDYEATDSIAVDNNIYISSSVGIIEDIVSGKGPQNSIIIFGYASWSPKQLEQEIIRNDWMVIDTDKEIIFNTEDEEKWNKAVKNLGIDMNRLSQQVGKA